MEDPGAQKESPTATPPLERRPIESNRMWLRDSLHWVERHQDLSTEPDLDPSRTGGVWTVLGSSESAGTRLRRLPKDARNEGRGSGETPLNPTCARARRRFGRHIRCGGPGMQPIRNIIPGGTQRPVSFPQQRPAIDTRSTAGRQSPLGFHCLREILNRLRRSVQLAVKRAGMRSGGLPPPPAPRSRTGAAVDHWGESRSGSALTAA
jgi:hypothetical protein